MLSRSNRTVACHRHLPSQCSLFVALLFAVCLISIPIRAQSGGGVDMNGTGGRHTIQGRVLYPSGQRADARLKVELESTSFGGLSVLTDSNGSFSFRGLQSGGYTVVVDGGKVYETMRESVYIYDEGAANIKGIGANNPRTYMVTVYLQPKRGNAGVAKPGVFNAALANVPKGAVELYQKALESTRAGDAKKAIEQLNGALAFYPNFPLALNELGVQHLKLGQPDKAADALRQALKITPEAFTPRLNYGIAMLEQKQYNEAEAQLRQAIKKNDAAPTPHLYLGIALIKSLNYAEAEKELQRAASAGGNEMSQAHYYLGGVYWGERKYKQAADELEKYLQLAPKAPNSERLRVTIKELRAK